MTKHRVQNSHIVRYVAVTAFAGIVGLGIAGCSSSSQPPVAETTSPSSATSSTSHPDRQPLKPTPLNKPAQFGNGVSASIVKIERVNLSARGPGELAGPGIRVEVRITNGSKNTVDVGNAVVNLAYGTAHSPAEATASQDKPFAGSITPGDSATAVYNFHVPTNGNPVMVSVSYTADQPVVVFVGRV